MIRKLFSIIALMTLVVSASAQSNESAHSLRIYSHSGMTKVAMKPGWTISHSRNDATGAAHNDCVALVISDGDSTVLTLPIADIDSLVMPGRRTVVFHGATVETPALGKAITANSAVNDTQKDDATPPLLRSSFSGNFPGKGSSNVTFYWTENDRIQLETGDFSHARNLSSDKTKASFVFDGADLDADTYGVYYPNKTVHISSIQTQTGADNSDHIGAAGDCGYDDATLTNDGSYTFTLKHKAAYFCFLPHIDYLPSVKVTKIVVHASSAIAGDYQMSASGLYNGANTSQNITLNLIPKNTNDFFIGHSAATEQNNCAAYMVFKPQNATYTVTYSLTDTLSHLSLTYIQKFSLNAQPNTVYPVTCNIPERFFEYVSLGSDYLWGTHNYGAVVPNGNGSKYNYSEADTILSKDNSWDIPDKEAVSEILNNCSWQKGTYNGTEGWFITSSDSPNTTEPYRIFLTSGSIWTKRDTTTSNPAKAIAITADGHSMTDIDNGQLLSIRPVRVLDKEYRIPYKGTETISFSGINNGYGFNVYDHAGKNANYDNDADGYLYIQCPDNHKVNIAGTVNTENDRDPLEIYEVNASGDKRICYISGQNKNINVTTDANVILLHFKSDGSVTYSGINLRVNIERKNVKYNVDIITTDGGTVSASKTTANPEDTIALHVVPNAGYVLDHYDIHTADTVLTIYDDDPQMFKDNPSPSRHYVMSDSVRARNGNFWHDDAWFIMPYGNVTVTPVWAKNDTTLYVDVPCSGTMTIEKKYIQRLISAGITAFRFYDYAGKNGKYFDDNVDGSLLIEAPDRYNLKAQGKISTEAACDPLIIYDGGTNDSPVLVNSGGNNTFDVTALYDNGMLVRFKTDNSKNGYDGFEGVISFAKDSTVCYDVPYQSNDTITAVVLKEKFEQGIKCIRIFDHGGIGGNYNNYCNGSITLILPLGTTADINGTLDSESNYDWLYIYDDGTEQIKQSGSQTISYSSTSNIITIKFTSDKSNVSSGFDLTLNIKKKDSE